MTGVAACPAIKCAWLKRQRLRLVFFLVDKRGNYHFGHLYLGVVLIGLFILFSLNLII